MGQKSGFEVEGSGLRVYGSESRVLVSLRVKGSGLQGFGFRVKVLS